MERALANAAAAVVAQSGIDDQTAIFQLRRADGAGGLDLALFAALALGLVIARDPGAHDAQIVQVRLDAVVGTAAHRDLELVGQRHVRVTLEEPVMDLIAQRVSVIQAILAGGTLAGNHRTYFAAGTAGLQTRFSHIGTESVDVVVIDAGDLHGQAGGEHHVAVAVPLGRFGDRLTLLIGDTAVTGNDAAVEFVGALVVEESHGLDTLDVLGAQGAACAGGTGSPVVQLVNKFLQRLGGQLHGGAAAAGFGLIPGSQSGAVRGAAGQFQRKGLHKPGAQFLQILPLAILLAQHTDSACQSAASAPAAHAGAEPGKKGGIRLSQSQVVHLIGGQQDGLSASLVQNSVVVARSLFQRHSKILHFVTGKI